MSIVIACKKDGVIYMGTDTRIIVNDRKMSEVCESNYKIQKLDNGILLGVAGERMERQTIFTYSDVFTLDKKGKLTKKHIVNEIVPKLFGIFKQEKIFVEKEEQVPYVRARMILAYQDVMYEIGADLSVLRYEDFQVLGLVAGYAQATLANSKETDDVNERILRALDITAEYCQYVGAPYLLIDTKEGKYRVVKEVK